MAFWFGDGFDMYSAIADVATFWDATLGSTSLTAGATGRFSGSRALGTFNNGIVAPHITKTSNQNDAVHHFSLALQHTLAFSGTTAMISIFLYDGATAQCTVVFQSDGSIVLKSGLSNGTVLATYTGAIPAINTWYQYEIEVVISNTAGSIAVRRNGNSVNDFSATSLNTRNSANNYANKIGIGFITNSGNPEQIDDFLWRSDAASVPWVGDIRCYTRMPASDVSVQFSRSSSAGATQTVPGGGGPVAIASTTAHYVQYTPLFSGTIATATVVAATGNSGNVKCALFDSNGGSGGPGAVLGTATAVTPLVTGTTTFTFPTPVTVSRGVPIWLGVTSDTSTGNWAFSSTTTTRATATTTYAAFPTANPTLASGPSAAQALNSSIVISPNSNYTMVAEAQQDAAATYVYSTNPGDADLYTIAAIAGGQPVTTLAVTTRGYAQKTDAGTRLLGMQLKSGATVSPGSGSSTSLNANSWQWVSRTDLVDPATGVAWTAGAVASLLVGPVVTA